MVLSLLSSGATGAAPASEGFLSDFCKNRVTLGVSFPVMELIMIANPPQEVPDNTFILLCKEFSHQMEGATDEQSTTIYF